MSDERKEIEQALEAAAAELKAKGAAGTSAEEPAAPEGTETVVLDPPAEETVVLEPSAPQAESAPEAPEEKEAQSPKAENTAKSGKKPKDIASFKELTKVRRNKIIGITAAALAIMVGIFLIARHAAQDPAHAKPTVLEDGTMVYPDGTQELPDGTVIEPDGTQELSDGTVVAPDGTVTTPDGMVIPAEVASPGDSNVSNVTADNGAAGGAGETAWSTMTDGDYQISMRRLNAYSGPFLEDGSDDEVTDILALQFRNDGELAIQYAEYVFEANGEDVVFKFSNVPAGQRCVVLAANKHAFNADEVLTLKSRVVAQVDYLPTADSQLLLVNNGDDSISVLNLTGEAIPLARVFYKTYYPDEDTFIGGITYSVEFKDIPAGGSSGSVAPSHFSSDYSMFVGSGVYEAES